MKLILFITIALEFSKISEALNPYDVGYRLAVGPLELFLRFGKENVPYCYQENKDDYENSIIVFLKELDVIKNYMYESFSVASKSIDYFTWGWNEMNFIANSLNTFFGELKANIFNGHLEEGGKGIWQQRVKLEDHYRQYLKHGNTLKEVNIKYYDSNFSPMDVAFKKILTKSEDLISKILQCLKKKGVTFTKKILEKRNN